MTRTASQDQINDHRRDELKHEWRPGDPTPLRFDVKVPMAIEIALLARSPAVSLTAAAELIEQYARTAASEARLEAVAETSNRMLSMLEGGVNA